MGSYRGAYESEGVKIKGFHFNETIRGLYLSDTMVFEINQAYAVKELPVRIGPVVPLDAGEHIPRQGRTFAVGMYLHYTFQRKKSGSSSLEDAFDLLQGQIIGDLTAVVSDVKQKKKKKRT